MHFILGKGTFDDLHEPGQKREHLMRFCADEAVCFFDFRGRGERKRQHVSPHRGHLDARLRGSTRVGQGTAAPQHNRNL